MITPELTQYNQQADELKALLVRYHDLPVYRTRHEIETAVRQIKLIGSFAWTPDAVTLLCSQALDHISVEFSAMMAKQLLKI